MPRLHCTCPAALCVDPPSTVGGQATAAKLLGPNSLVVRNNRLFIGECVARNPPSHTTLVHRVNFQSLQRHTLLLSCSLSVANHQTAQALVPQRAYARLRTVITYMGLFGGTVWLTWHAPPPPFTP
jgi:hypothetical protein